MLVKYFCEICNEKFDEAKECFEHEIQHIEKKFTCDKCGKTLDYDFSKYEYLLYLNQFHHINLGRAGYGSKLDGCDLVFNLCDDCLYDFIMTFRNKDKILYSGSNYKYN